MSKPQRLDLALVERGLIETRSRAKAFILAGDVLVNELKQTRAGHLVGPNDTVALRQKPRFVSRGGEKLDHALNAFAVEVPGTVVADLGASTGGFTDCVLQRGATRVYAIDVGYGQLDARLRDDERVVVMERTNARYIETLPEPVDIVVIDVSFISLALMFPVVARVLRPGGACVPLIKPQFEAGREEIGKGGVVRDNAIREAVLRRTVKDAARHNLSVRGLVASPLRGPAGNVEFLGHFVLKKSSLGVESPEDVDAMIAGALLEADQIGVAGNNT